MSSTDIDSNIYVGQWTNWSRGPVLGATLTLTREQGNLFIAFTASFVAFVSVRFWHLLCLVIHRFYTTEGRPRSAIYHQRHTILRNSANPESAFVSLYFLLLAWFRSYRGGLGRLFGAILPLFLLAVVVWTAFAVAGGFSANIAFSVGQTVRLTGENCGFVKTALPMDSESVSLWLTEGAATCSAAHDYARQCYSNNASVSSGTVDCGRFVRSNIPWSADSHAPCPFDSTMCLSQDRNLRLDTGILDWTTNLGVNAPPGQRLSLRTVQHCAPLVTDGFRSHVVGDNGIARVRYHYGGKPEPLDPSTMVNYTYQAADVATQYEYIDAPGMEPADGHNFRVGTSASYSYRGEPILSGGQYMLPLPELFRPDGDLTIVFLSGNGVRFDEPWPDPWYRGTVFSTNGTTAGAGSLKPSYEPEEAASPLGCVEQWQICNPSGDGGGEEDNCTPLSSINDALRLAAPLFNTTEAAMGPAIGSDRPPPGGADAQRLWWFASLFSAQNVDIRTMLDNLGNKALATQAALFSGMQYAFTGDDADAPVWHADVENWFGTMMATLQTSFVYAPIGPLADSAAARVNLTADEFPDLCGAQLVKSSLYTSFSMFGLFFTYGLGALIVITSWSIESVLRWCLKKRKFQEHWQVEWAAGGSLQLLRMAQEEAGYGEGWTKCDEDVPITGSRDALLGGTDMSDPEHPVIARHGCSSGGYNDGDDEHKGASSPTVEETTW